MSKEFTSYEQQICLLEEKKGLQIADKAYAEKMLRRYSYYALITVIKIYLRTLPREPIDLASDLRILSIYLSLMQPFVNCSLSIFCE